MAPDEKAVVFSQWTSYLDIIEQELRKEGHFFCRIDGTMTADDRYSSMEKFDTKPTDSFQTPRFILCSLHACGTGTECKLLSLVMLTLSLQE
jgi:SWI/SNF-related matrix-associated actin-dependent regulator of chromatin subfamily A3